MNQNIILDSITYSGSRYLLLGLGFVRNLVIAGVLLPQQYGLWVLFLTIMFYADQAHLGLRHYGDWEIPFLMGGGRTNDLKALIGNIRFGIAFLGLIFFFGTVGTALLAFRSDKEFFWGLILLGGIVMTDQLNKFYFMTMRAFKEFARLSRVESGFEVGRTFVLCIAVTMAGVTGALGALCVSNLVLLAFFSLGLRNQVGHSGRSVKVVASLVASGFPLLMNGLFFLVAFYVDRVFVAATLSKSDLGMYGIAALFASFPVNTSQAVSMVMYPRMSEMAGSSEGMTRLPEYFLKALTGLSLIIPPLVMSGVYFAPVVVVGALPAYGPSLKAMTILFIGSAFFSLVSLCSFFLFARRELRVANTLQFAGLLVTLVLFGLFFLFYDPSIERVASVMAASMSIITVFMMGIALSRALKGMEVLSQTAKHFFFIAVTVSLVIFIGYLFDSLLPSRTLSSLLITALIKTMCFGVLYVLGIAICRHTGILTLPPFQSPFLKLRWIQRPR